jgi:hypothetical protein
LILIWFKKPIEPLLASAWVKGFASPSLKSARDKTHVPANLLKT